MAPPKTLFAFGLNHKTAPVEIRERLYLNEAEISSLLCEFKRTLSECVVISTCNRTEFYGVSDAEDVDVEVYKNLLIDFKGVRGLVEDHHFFTLISCAACQQLFTVATSIDSQIVGDSQILKQVREAYLLANGMGATGKVLNQLLQRAFKIGKKTFTETSIHDGAVSVSLAGVELATETFGSLRGRSVLVVGAGEMARLTAEALGNRRIGRLLLANRTRAHAEEMLTKLPAETAGVAEIIDFSDLAESLSRVDIVITSTGSELPIITKVDVANVGRRTLFIDLAVPRDVDPNITENPHAVLKNIDDLHTIIDGNHDKRKQDLPKVKRLIMTEMVDFLTWYYSLPLMPEHRKIWEKSPAGQAEEYLRIKTFLGENVSEIHKLAARATGDFKQDFDSHISLVRLLQSRKEAAFASPGV
jgi:glutamyl-tRNA reductase